MNRRLMLSALACWPGTRLAAQDESARPRLKISAGQLHQALSARFPVRLGVPGVLTVQVSAPSLYLLPARNRLGAALVAEVAGLPRQQAAGELDLLFALRCERADRTVRAYAPEVRDLRWPGLPPQTADALQQVLPALAGDAFGELVLHRFSAGDLALADTLGFEPDRITVVDDGVVVSFAPKPPR